MNILRTAPVALLLLAAACSGASGPAGPNGGANEYDVVVDGEGVDFDRVSLSLVATGTSATTLRLDGVVETQAGAEDAWYGYQMTLGLDLAALAALPLPATVEVRGTTQYDGIRLEQGQISWSNAGSASVSRTVFAYTCNCPESGAGTQSFDGTLLLTRIDATSLTGTLQVSLQGDLPQLSGAHTATVVAEFDLARP